MGRWVTIFVTPGLGWADGHGPDAWRGPDGSSVVRYTSLGGPGRAGGWHLVTALNGQKGSQQAHQRAG